MILFSDVWISTRQSLTLKPAGAACGQRQLHVF